MKTTKTIELTEEEIYIVQNFLALVDEISDASGKASMDDVFQYFLDVADLGEGNVYRIGKLHKLDEIG